MASVRTVPRTPAIAAQQTNAGRLLCLIAVFLASLNLRPTVTTVAAVMNEAKIEFALSDGQLLLLGMLPVLAFGLTAPIASILGRRLGVNNAMAWALVALALVLVIRVVNNSLLLPATFAAGAAIMVVSVLAPRALKFHGANGWWTGLASVGFGVGAALGAALVHPLEVISGNSLRWALALWAVPALLAAALVFVSSWRLPRDSEIQNRAAAGRSSGTFKKLIRQPVTIAVTCFFGLQALLYFSVTSWLPSLLVDRGVSESEAAMYLAWFSVAGFVPTLLMPVLASKPMWLKVLPAVIGVLILIGFGLLLLASGPALLPVVCFLGAFQSAAFGLGLALIVYRSKDTQTAGEMSSTAQGGGFALAASGPFIIGAIHQTTGGWTWPVVGLAVFAALVVVAGVLSVRGPAANLD